MQNPDYQKYYVLHVDDEEKSLKSFQRAFGSQFKVLTAPSAVEGIQIIESHLEDVAILVTDQMMPGHKGVWLLDKVRQLKPSILRILATAYSDLNAVIQAVNTGAIFHYVTKPWDQAQLENTLRHGLQLFMVQRERDQLLREKMSVLHNMMVADRVVSLGFMAVGMSHHIRNSLVPVKTFIDLVPQQLRDESIDPDQGKNREFWTEHQRCAQQHLDKINILLKELWMVADTPRIEFTDRVHLRDVISDSKVRQREILAAKNIAIEIQIPETLPVLTVDRNRFARIFDLLIKDEVISLPEGGRITITASVVNDAASERVLVKVRDNGPGITEDILRTIFDPFTARSDSPSEHGINLMACYFIVHYHGGRIEAHGVSGRGTEFQLEFPVSGISPVLHTENLQFFDKLRAADETWENLLAKR
jgi:two-component system, probable response regulator PhcQ